MTFDFSLILVMLCGLTGATWLVDSVMFARKRKNGLMQFLQVHGVSPEDYRQYRDYLDATVVPTMTTGKGHPSVATGQGAGNIQRALIAQARVTYRTPLPVDYARSLFPILLAVLILRSFLFEPFQIPSPSMVPTLQVGDFIVVNKFSYGLRLPVIGTKILSVGEPKRGDVMVFVPPHDPRYFIKRVIGLPRDRIRYENDIVYVNGKPLTQEPVGLVDGKGTRVMHEKIGALTHSIHSDVLRREDHDYRWLDAAGRLRSGWLPPQGMVVPEGHYFMMGDNRDHSEDSRYWGPAAEANIVGKAVAVWMHKEPGWQLPTFSENRLIENAR